MDLLKNMYLCIERKKKIKKEVVGRPTTKHTKKFTFSSHATTISKHFLRKASLPLRNIISLTVEMYV